MEDEEWQKNEVLTYTNIIWVNDEDSSDTTSDTFYYFARILLKLIGKHLQC